MPVVPVGQFDELRVEVRLGKLEETIQVVEALAGGLDGLVPIESLEVAAPETFAAVVGQVDVPMAIHPQNSSGFLVDQQTAAREVGPQLGLEDDLGITVMADEPIYR